jgi:hypothetical protein
MISTDRDLALVLKNVGELDARRSGSSPFISGRNLYPQSSRHGHDAREERTERDAPLITSNRALVGVVTGTWPGHVDGACTDFGSRLHLASQVGPGFAGEVERFDARHHQHL